MFVLSENDVEMHEPPESDAESQEDVPQPSEADASPEPDGYEGPAHDLTLDEFEALEERQTAGRRRPSARWWFALVALIALAGIALIIFDHRHTPCHFRQYSLGKGSLFEYCAKK